MIFRGWLLLLSKKFGRSAPLYLGVSRLEPFTTTTASASGSLAPPLAPPTTNACIKWLEMTVARIPDGCHTVRLSDPTMGLGTRSAWYWPVLSAAASSRNDLPEP